MAMRKALNVLGFTGALFQFVRAEWAWFHDWPVAVTWFDVSWIYFLLGAYWIDRLTGDTDGE
jgi:hypothetical protein